MRPHSIDRCAKLLDIAHIGAEPQGHTSAVFDFQVGKIKFGFASS